MVPDVMSCQHCPGFPQSCIPAGFSFTMTILAVVSLALYYPQYFVKVGDFKLSGLIVPLLQVIMFGMGTELSLKDFAAVLRMPRGVIIGVICHYTIMPLVGFTLARAFHFPPEIAAGIILVGCCPAVWLPMSWLFLRGLTWHCRYLSRQCLRCWRLPYAHDDAPVGRTVHRSALAGHGLGHYEDGDLPVIAGLLFHYLVRGNSNG